MIITIARQCGCMGDQIGKALAEKYFIPFYDKDAVCRLAKEKGLYEKYPYFYGEMPLDMMLYADIIDNENCVVVGRCGNNAFRHREDVISVFLTGNKEKRAELIEKKHNVSPKKAAKIVEDTDLRRRSYHNYYTGEEWGNAEYYDICIDVSKVGEDGALRLIEAYINETGVL